MLASVAVNLQFGIMHIRVSIFDTNIKISLHGILWILNSRKKRES